ncbi:MAG: prephenate dehydrogenase/arogenate dehydrogenase family protein [Candidatus Parcubacteria bacterium]|nr:prephenate dehydrogenase/arogenate dehydrogenase family protein [Candidatus Parcubacteria bacterium]
MKKNINKKPLIGIIGGNGKIGNWFKNFFESQGLKVLISDIDTELTNIELAKSADIVMVSVPIKVTQKVIEEIRHFVRKDALLCDNTSLKSASVAAMKKAKSGVLGIHPLFGPQILYLERQKIVFCRVKDNQWVFFLKNLFIKNNAKIIEVSPEEHDYQMAIIQALIHFSNIGVARTIYNQKINFNSSFFTPTFRLQSLIIGRMLAQDPKLYADIEMENPYFKKILLEFEKEIKGLAEDVRKKDTKKFSKKFEEVSSYLADFKRIAEIKSTEVLRIVDHQPIKIKNKEKIPVFDFIRKKKIGFLGPAGTFSHQAALSVFPRNSNLISFLTIHEVFKNINDNKIDFGIVPAENTISGIIPETNNALFDYPLKTTGSFNFQIKHYLLGMAKKKEEIEIIRSKQQVFSQCQKWLRDNLPKVKHEETTSTTAPILENKGRNIGFIASEIAGKIYKLNVLAEDIEDNKENFTKFYLISKELDRNMQKKLKANKTLLLLSVYDRVGILRDILDIFAKNNLNLTSLQSIPSHSKPWDYLFFLEVVVFYPSAKVKKVLKDLEKYCPVVRVLGVS